jgi:hypothetical protein
VALLAVSAVLATLDIVYDRYLSPAWGVLAVFFAFNLFACINVMLPVVWNFRSSFALRLSALLALAGFASLTFARGGGRGRWPRVGAAALLLAAIAWLGQPLVPPAPLRLLASGFGANMDADRRELSAPFTTLPVGGPLRVYALTSIMAPLGLKDRVGHRWFLDGKLVFASPFFELQGGRRNGFRLWTFRTLDNVGNGSRLRVDVRTEGGQVIGRAYIRAANDVPEAIQTPIATQVKPRGSG